LVTIAEVAFLVLAGAALIVALALFAFFLIMAMTQYFRALVSLINSAAEVQAKVPTYADASPYLTSDDYETSVDDERDFTTNVTPGIPYDANDFVGVAKAEREARTLDLRDTNANDDFDDNPFMRQEDGSASRT